METPDPSKIEYPKDAPQPPPSYAARWNQKANAANAATAKGGRRGAARRETDRAKLAAAERTAAFGPPTYDARYTPMVRPTYQWRVLMAWGKVEEMAELPVMHGIFLGFGPGPRVWVKTRKRKWRSIDLAPLLEKIKGWL